MIFSLYLGPPKGNQVSKQKRVRDQWQTAMDESQLSTAAMTDNT